MINILIAILLFLVILRWDVKSDAKKTKVDHTKEAWIRAAFLLPSYLCFLFPIDNTNVWMIISKLVVTALMMEAWWWEFFDGCLNIEKDHSWRFNGSDDKDDAISDNILQELSPVKQAILKWGLIILFTTLYIIIK